MRVSVLQENLAKGLGIVNRALTSRPSLPVLNNVLLSTEDARLKLAVTNLELGITAWIGANVDTDGGITVPARTLLDLVNTLPPERVDLDLDARTQTLKVKCNSTTANIKGIEAGQFPAVPEAEADTGIAISAAAFQEMINHVIFAAAKEDNRPILTGVLAKFDGGTFNMVATDGYRLSVRSTTLETPASKSTTLIIPAKTLGELGRIISEDDNVVYVSIPPGRNQVMFHLDKVDVVSQLIDGKFPDFDQIIPKTHNTTTRVYTQDLLQACKRAEIFARDASNTMRVRVTPSQSNQTPGQLSVAAQSQEKGDNEAILDVAVEGTGIDIAFNVRYLMEVLNVIPEEQIALETNGSSSPGVVKPVGRDDFTYVIMPMSTTH